MATLRRSGLSWNTDRKRFMWPWLNAIIMTKELADLLINVKMSEMPGTEGEPFI
jgi:hypothetical protein